MSCCKHGRTFRTSCAARVPGQHFLERLNWFHSGISVDRGRGSMFCFDFIAFQTLAESRKRRKINFIAHKENLMFQNKTHLAICLCTPLTLVHCLLRPRERWCNEGKQINISENSACKDGNRWESRRWNWQRFSVCAGREKRFRHIKFPIAFVNTRDVLWWESECKKRVLFRQASVPAP